MRLMIAGTAVMTRMLKKGCLYACLRPASPVLVKTGSKKYIYPSFITIVC